MRKYYNNHTRCVHEDCEGRGRQYPKPGLLKAHLVSTHAMSEADAQTMINEHAYSESEIHQLPARPPLKRIDKQHNEGPAPKRIKKG